MPIPSQTNDSSGTLPRPIRSVANGSETSSRIDLNRPLPPPPSSSVDSYDIPSLRRKPVPKPSNSDSGSAKHNRSFSHPFPSFFGSRRGEKKGSNRVDGKLSGARETNEILEDSSSPLEQSPRSTSQNLGNKTDRQPVTGKCMTCDSTVRWPQGLKVYRCTTCLTINDLEPYEDQWNELQSSSKTIPQASPPRPLPLSLERTRKLIDSCYTHYFEKQLEQDSAISDTDQHATDNITSAETTLFPHTRNNESPPPSPLSMLNTRAPSDSALTPFQLHRQRSRLPSNVETTDFVDRDDIPSIKRPSTAAGMDAQLDMTPSRSDSTRNSSMFRPLETYITNSFSGCATFNTSFFTVKPQNEARPSTGSGSQQRRQTSEPGVTPTYEPDVFFSELDAKTLLLGDVAENGLWWTGGRTARNEKEDVRPRDRSPEKWRGIVTARTPRINWAEVAEWYRLIIHAGDIWKKKWQKFHDKLPASKEVLWQTVSLDRMQREITESQIHLQRGLLKATENLLKRPRRPLKHPEDCRFLLMILVNPLLYPQSIQNSAAMANTSADAPSSNARLGEDSTQMSPVRRAPGSAKRPSSLGHHSGIVKRVLGLISNLTNDVHNFLISWFSRFSDNHFQKIVELIGSFVTYRLSRQQRRPIAEPINPTEGLVPSFTDSGVRHPSQLHAALDIRSSSTSAKSSDGKPKLSSYGEDWQVRAAARVMALLFQANSGHNSRKRDLASSADTQLYNAGLNAKLQAYSHGQMIPISSFYNTMLDYADLVADFETWETTKGKFAFCQYPFFLSIYAKIHILEHDARRQMENKAREAFFDSILSRKAVSQYLVLKVRRDCLVEDSLRNVSEVIGAGAGDIKKGLRIDFQGEEGIDAGGLRKEWFLLLVREIFDPHHGLFVYDEDSHYCYFNPFCFESSEQFFLVGVLLGLAIYNSTILDVAFPPFVFKKLLASAPLAPEKQNSIPKVTNSYTLEDLAEFRPALARGVRQLLEFDGDVQDVFCRDFVAEMDRYGELVQVPLCPNGEKRAVTNSNRREFVDLYIHYLLDTAVARQYEPFKRGFFTVCGGNALSLFRPEEIELLVRGSEEPLDIPSLRAVASYDGWPKHGGPPEAQPQVIWFWNFFQRAPPADQRKILSFITGSDRIPAMGATNLIIRIQLLRLKDDNDLNGKGIANDIERFPIARTCFNTLSLYRYGSQERLEQKLWMAVTGSEGFGLK